MKIVRNFMVPTKKVLLEHSHTYSFTCCQWLLLCCSPAHFRIQRPHGPRSLKYLLPDPLLREFADLCMKVKEQFCTNAGK